MQWNIKKPHRDEIVGKNLEESLKNDNIHKIIETSNLEKKELMNKIWHVTFYSITGKEVASWWVKAVFMTGEYTISQ